MRLNCKLCGSQTKMVGHNFICDRCGWHKLSNNEVNERSQNQIVKGMIIAGFALMGFFSYISYFGSHSLRIIPLKIMQLTGNLNQHSHDKLVKICMKLKQYNCVEKAHFSYFTSSKDLTVLSALADFQYKRDRLNESAQTYYRYFELKGKDSRTAYNYARVLEKQGQINAALKYYEYSLYAGSTNKLRITAMRDYINLLVKNNQAHKAHKALLKIQPGIKKASALVQQEYHRWQEQVKKG